MRSFLGRVYPVRTELCLLWDPEWSAGLMGKLADGLCVLRNGGALGCEAYSQSRGRWGTRLRWVTGLKPQRGSEVLSTFALFHQISMRHLGAHSCGILGSLHLSGKGEIFLASWGWGAGWSEPCHRSKGSIKNSINRIHPYTESQWGALRGDLGQ